MCIKKVSLQNYLHNLWLNRETNLIRSLTARLEDGHCSITVANHGLIRLVRFIASNCTHLWKGFANRLYLVSHACKIFWVNFFHVHSKPSLYYVGTRCTTPAGSRKRGTCMVRAPQWFPIRVCSCSPFTQGRVENEEWKLAVLKMRYSKGYLNTNHKTKYMISLKIARRI